jgi:hypothetical protein
MASFNPTQVWLRCDVLNEENTQVEIRVVLQDNTTANLNVHSTLLGSDKEGKRYILCESFGRKNKLVSIKLPRPTLQYGHNIIVKESETKVKI